jgi:sugar lactone lactonase YvrE
MAEARLSSCAKNLFHTTYLTGASFLQHWCCRKGCMHAARSDRNASRQNVIANPPVAARFGVSLQGRRACLVLAPLQQKIIRERTMKLWLAALLVLSTSASFAQDNPPVIPFNSVPNPLRLPDNMYFGEVSGVAVNSKGHVFVLSRGNTSGPAYAAAATQLLEFDANGKYIREIGKNLYAWSFAHTVKVDPQDNIWVTDKGSDMVIKFSPEGRVLMVFGRKQEASDEETGPLKHPNPPLPAEDGRFRQVTDVAWDAAGNTYISDGYINSRVAKVDKDGNWIKSWGEKGSEPGQFNTPHSIATDAKGNVYVADRSQSGALCFRCVARTDLQDDTGRKAARCSRQVGQAVEAVWVGSCDSVPVGEHALCCGASELARAEARFASEVITRRNGSGGLMARFNRP